MAGLKRIVRAIPFRRGASTCPRTSLISIVWVFLLAIGALVIQVQPSGAANGTHCMRETGAETRAPHLADQESDPFLFLGKPINESHPLWSRYKRPISSFPTVLDCLRPEEVGASEPDLNNFDWGRVGTGARAEVCVFRVARSMTDTGAIFEWLSHQGFFFEEKLVPYKGVSFEPRFPNDPVYNVSAVWTVQQYRERNPSLLARIFGFDTVHGYTLVLQFSEACEVVGASTSTSSK